MADDAILNDDMQDDALNDEDDVVEDANEEIIDADSEQEEEEANNDVINAHNTGDELVDENDWEAKEFNEAVEGEDGDDVPPGMHIVGDTEAIVDLDDDDSSDL